MSSPVPADCQKKLLDPAHRDSQTDTHPFLLQPDPSALVEVELVDWPVELAQEQFQALLIDSECEV